MEENAEQMTAQQQVRSFLRDMKSMAEACSSAEIRIWSGIDCSGERPSWKNAITDPIGTSEQALNEALIELETIDNLSLGWVGSFSIVTDPTKLRLATEHLGEPGKDFAERLIKWAGVLADACGESAFRIACELHAEAVERACVAWIDPFPPFDQEPTKPDFVLYEACQTVKQQVRLFRRRVIQEVPLAERSTETDALNSSREELERIGKLFEYAWRVLSGMSESVVAGCVSEPVFRPARWFDRATGGALNADRLRKAADAERLQSEKVGGLRHYSVDQVKRVWPEHMPKLSEALENDRNSPEESGKARK